MSQFENFSSLSPAQEQTFAVYEERMAIATKKGYTIAGIVAAVVFVFSLAIFFGVTPDDPDNEAMSKDMNMSNLSGPAAPAK